MPIPKDTEAVIGMALGGIAASLHLAETLADAGLLSPKRFDEMAHALISPLEEIEADNQLAGLLRTLFDQHFGDLLADIQRKARQTWKGPA